MLQNKRKGRSGPKRRGSRSKVGSFFRRASSRPTQFRTPRRNLAVVTNPPSTLPPNSSHTPIVAHSPSAHTTRVSDECQNVPATTRGQPPTPQPSVEIGPTSPTHPPHLRGRITGPAPSPSNGCHVASQEQSGIPTTPSTTNSPGCNILPACPHPGPMATMNACHQTRP